MEEKKNMQKEAAYSNRFLRSLYFDTSVHSGLYDSLQVISLSQ